MQEPLAPGDATAVAPAIATADPGSGPDLSPAVATADPGHPVGPPPSAVRPDLAPRDRLGDGLRRVAQRAARPGPAQRLDGGAMVALLAVVGLVLFATTDQIVPASSAHQAQLRIWLASRAAGLAALGLLAIQILIGLVLSHPTNKATWRLSRAIFPWHETLWLFVLAFVVAHVAAIVVDPYAGVGLAGALIPGLSSYRSTPVALGSLALDALVITGLTARWTRLLPGGAWLLVHRAALGIFVLAWMHGLLAGTDSPVLVLAYVALAVAIALAAVHRFWARERDPFEPEPPTTPASQPVRSLP